MVNRDDYLFSDAALSDFLGQRRQKITAEVEQMTSEYLVKADLDQVTGYLEDRFKIKPAKVQEDRIYVAEHGDTKVDMTGNPTYGARFGGGPVLVPATFVIFAVPYSGDWQLFRLQPSTFSTGRPRAKIVNGELRFKYYNTDHDSAAIKNQFERDLQLTKQYISWGQDDVSRFNQHLRIQIREHLDRRKEKFAKDKGLAEGLGFPIKPRQQITTYAPVTRKKLPLPIVTPEKALSPEPHLEQAQYDHILSVISNMNLVMERSPKAFREMGEEDLRTHILVQLNGHYEGRSTGETFNYDGKTDILIRDNDRNIFIAECKVWKGPEVFSQTIDQLLGYAAWRDTKTAIIVFNRNKNLSGVLAQIPELVKKHPNCKRQIIEYRNETGFRFILRHRDDQNKEMMLTVLVFDVPGSEGAVRA